MADLRNAPDDTYLAEVAEIAADLRSAFTRHAKARPWAHTAEHVDYTAIAQATMTARRRTPSPIESAQNKALRSAAKRFAHLLQHARDAEIEAAREHGHDLDAYILSKFAPAIDCANDFARPARMTRIAFVARKVLDAIAIANRHAALRGARSIPTSLGRDGAVVALTLAALRFTPEIEALAASSANMQRAKQAHRRMFRAAGCNGRSDEEGRLRDVIAKHIAARL